MITEADVSHVGDVEIPSSRNNSSETSTRSYHHVTGVLGQGLTMVRDRTNIDCISKKDTGGSRRGGGNPTMPSQSPGRGASCLLPPKSSPKTFSGSEFGSTPKNSGLNPWSFQFWGYPRLGPHTKLAPLKPAAGSASDCRYY